MANKKKKTISILATGLLFCLSVATVSAQEESANEELIDTGWTNPYEDTMPECGDYYHYGAIKFDFSGDKSEYEKGEGIRVSGKIINETGQPVRDGYVMARFARIDPNDLSALGDIVSESIPFYELHFLKDEAKDLAFDFHPPKDIPAGTYRMSFYFSVSKQYNLAGLPFTNDIRGGFFDVRYDSDIKDFLHFDRESTKVNGNPYPHIGNWPQLPAQSDFKVLQDIVNGSGVEKEVNVSYDLFYWDSLNESDLLENKTESIKLAPGEKKTLSYEGKMNESVYMLRITAEAEGMRSIVNIRLTSPQVRLSLNHPALTSFPLTKGDQSTAYACFYNASIGVASGTLEMILFDDQDNEILREEYQGIMRGKIFALHKDFEAKKDLPLVRLSAKIYDENKEVVDSYVATYDCNAFGFCPQEKSPIQKDIANKKSIFLLLIIVFLALLGLILIILAIFKLKNKKNVQDV